MAIPFSCKCPQRKVKPASKRKWGVLRRNYHMSAFAGYHRTYSDYSTVACFECGAIGRTKAGYVSQLLDVDFKDYLKSKYGDTGLAVPEKKPGSIISCD